MAIVHLQPTVGVTLRDGTNSVTTMLLNVRRGLSAAAGKSAAATLSSLADQASDCVPVARRYTLSYEEQAPAAHAGVKANTAVLIFETATIDQYLIIDLPGLNPSFVLTAGPGAGVELDVLKPALASFIDAIIAGVWCNPFGYQPTALLAALYEVRPA